MPPDPDGAKIEAMVERKKAGVQAKSDFPVEQFQSNSPSTHQHTTDSCSTTRSRSCASGGVEKRVCQRSVRM
jgi:hypothetical protein